MSRDPNARPMLDSEGRPPLGDGWNDLHDVGCSEGRICNCPWQERAAWEGQRERFQAALDKLKAALDNVPLYPGPYPASPKRLKRAS